MRFNKTKSITSEVVLSEVRPPGFFGSLCALPDQPPRLSSMAGAVPRLQRFRRWFNPVRWRFWMLTMPLLSILAVVVLSTWPGLTCDWRISKELFFRRLKVPNPITVLGGADVPGLDDDVAEFGVGSVRILKIAGAGARYAASGEPGFNVLNNHLSWKVRWLLPNSVTDFEVSRQWPPFQ